VLVSHPAVADARCRALILVNGGEDLLPGRIREAGLLRDAGFRQKIEARGVRLARFDELPAQGPVQRLNQVPA